LKLHKVTHVDIIRHVPEMGYIINFIKKYNIEKQFQLLGVKPNKEFLFYINNSDIGIGRFIQSKYVQFYMLTKCIEYMACEKLFITTPISEDVVHNYDTGIVIHIDFDEKDKTDNLIMLIEDNKLREELGGNGLKKVNKQFNWEVIMKKINTDFLKITNWNMLNLLNIMIISHLNCRAFNLGE